jgi:hypothetical protein
MGWGKVIDITGVREALHKQPFEPFDMRLADGRSLLVPHPDFVALLTPAWPMSQPEGTAGHGPVVGEAGFFVWRFELPDH